MKQVNWQRRRSGPETGLSFFLVVYGLGLVGVLLGIHALQPDRDDLGRASRSPVHAGRQSAG